MSGRRQTVAQPDDYRGLSAAGTHVVVAEHDPVLGSRIEVELTGAGYAVLRTATGRAAIAAVGARAPDLVLVNAQLPDIDGRAVCGQIRRDGCDAPVIMLIGRDWVGDRVIGPESGADAIVVTPVVIDELLARMRALARPGPDDTWISSGRVRLDTRVREVLVDQQRVELAAREFELLAFLMTAPGRAFTREQIYAGVWGGQYPRQTKVIDIAISGLRKKLDAPGDSLIRTVRRFGYIARK